MKSILLSLLLLLPNFVSASENHTCDPSQGRTLTQQDIKAYEQYLQNLEKEYTWLFEELIPQDKRSGELLDKAKKTFSNISLTAGRSSQNQVRCGALPSPPFQAVSAKSPERSPTWVFFDSPITMILSPTAKAVSPLRSGFIFKTQRVRIWPIFANT